ncbi:hypothetical protein D5R81_11015 [Parashewanella spongiae]|uniref:Uncharacterized protein n=1 Tax=Parashewanella spongiae TaxID=342950 RepID=A0A3A6U8E8_9GAMM|nr:hypothetical protein [Parashewanella spongiae]MCL1078453.1 hypothetical protein [Parashewanella spongiae]RJY14596.1 hypothetical protein D5R81_11015 [Parashewanella spongiae]
MATVRTPAEQQSIYRFMLKSLQEYPSEAVSYLNFEVSKFDGDENLQHCYQLLSKTYRQKLYYFFNNKPSSACSNSHTRETHYCKKPSNACRRFATEPRSITPKSSTRYTKQIQQPSSSSNSFFTQTSALIHSWKLKQKSKNKLGIELNSLIGGCTKLSQLIEIIHSLKNDKQTMETSWDIRLIHKMLHKAAEFPDNHSSSFDGIFSDIIRFKSSYEAKTCTLLLKLIKLNLNFSDAKGLVLSNAAEASLMQQWGIKPDVAIYNAFITVCAKTGQFDSAWQLVCGDKPVIAPHLPLKANQITCINLLAACAEAGRYAEAKSLVLGDSDTATTSLMQKWGIKPNVAIYNAFITVCAKTDQFNSAWQLVCGDKPVMASHLPLKVDEITCMNLLAACAEAGRYAEAKSLVLGDGATAIDSLMQQWDIESNVAIYSAFITVCVKTGQFDSAWQLVCGDKPVMAPHLPLKADSITCINLLTACAEAGRYAEAKSLVLGDTATASLMQQWGIKPDVAVYSAFITVCAKTGHFDRAWRLVCGDKPVMAPHLSLKACQITCINLLTACAEAGRYAEAKSLVLGDTATASLMQQWGIKPNVAIYSAFITVCAKTGQFDSAWQLVCGDKPVMAPHLSLKTNQITCMNLLTACAEMERFTEAKSLVLGDTDTDTDTDSLMQQWGIKPDVAIYNAFITVCAKTGQFDSAWRRLCSDKPVMAPHLSLKANKITCLNLLTACAETGHYAEAKSLVLGDTATASLMQQWGIKPDVAVYNAFITVCAKTDQFDSAWQLVCGDKPVMAPHLSLKANQITCMNLLAACAEAGRYTEAKSLVMGDGDTVTATDSLMQLWDIKPNIAIYSAFITVCAKTGQFDSAWQLVCGDKLVIAPHLPLKADSITCLNLLTACAEMERYAEAKSLVLGDGDTATTSLMQLWDIKPNVAIYNAFITVCAKTGHFDSAWQLVCGDKPVMAPHLQLKADSITCLNLLTACAETGRYAEAKSLVLGDGHTATASLMQQWDIKHDVAVYSAFITVCAKTGHFDSAWQLVCGDKPVMAPHLPLKADSITCLNLLTACAETGRYAEAKSLVLGDTATTSLMQHWGIKSNVAIYNAFITVCAKTGQFDSAWQLVCGDKPVMAPYLSLKANQITCINLLTACAEMERFTEAKSLVLDDGDTTATSLMQQWGIKPDIAIYSAFIKVCIKAKEFDTGIWYLEKIMNKCDMITLSQVHAQLASLEKDNFAIMIDKGITQGIYKKNVGLMSHCINLHMDKIFEGHSGNGKHIQGVPLGFAKLLFCYHKQNNEPNITSIITGYHGNNTLKNGMISFLKDEFGLEFIEGKLNSGMIVLRESPH